MPNPRTDAESDAEPDAKPNAESNAKPNVKPDAKPTDRLQFFGLGAMVGLQRGVRRRIPEAQSRGCHR